jgi:hypothetical protein
MIFEDLSLHLNCSENLRSCTDGAGTNVLNNIWTGCEWSLGTGVLFYIYCEKNEFHNVIFYSLY